MPSRDFPGTVEAAADAEAWIAGESGELGLASDTTFAIGLCVEELFLNAVKHGHANKATISIWTEPDGARIRFVDDGAPFDPTTTPAKRLHETGPDFKIGGFGVELVQKFSRRMTYRRADGANHLVLEFDFGLKRASGAGAIPA
ncbi:MAG TPA: ATP-binding protein [Roseiarcus sp.]|nr:ATP-binding protein [Roseiarcus sp.]